MLREPDPETDCLAQEVIGAGIEVHRHLGPGFLERVYEEALAVELELRRIPFVLKPRFRIQYKGRDVGEGIPDLLIDQRLPVELKAVRELAPIHRATVFSYLKLSGRHLALLLNFNVPKLKDGGIHRFVLS